MSKRKHGSLRARLLKGLLNPIFATEFVLEKVFTVFWVALFRIECLLKGVLVGRNVEIFCKCIIRKAPYTEIKIGDGVQIISSSWRSSTASCMRSKIRTFYPTAKVLMGNGSGMTGGSIIARSKTISIGERCMLAPNVTILDSNFHILWPPERRHDTWETDIDQDVTLERNVWVGMGVTILKGVTIGENSVITAGSVVVSSIPKNCLAGGNPAKVLRSLDR
jgi:acetyltransferase-like isoleucine patch superfamily enzyme